MKYKKYILSILIPFVILYLMGSFINISFDVREWSLPGRVFLCVFGGFFAVSSFMYIETFKDK